jgi:CHASE3 domain sensor protein
VLVCLTIIALGAVAYFTQRGIVRSRDWVIHTYQVRSRLSDLQLTVMRAEPHEAKSPLTPAGPQAHLSHEQSDLALQTVAELRSLTKDNPRQQQRLSQLGRMLKEDQPLLESQGNAIVR